MVTALHDNFRKKKNKQKKNSVRTHHTHNDFIYLFNYYYVFHMIHRPIAFQYSQPPQKI